MATVEIAGSKPVEVMTMSDDPGLARPGGLDGLHVLDHYWQPNAPRRTEVGELVHRAKDHGDMAAAARLAERLAAAVAVRLDALGSAMLVTVIPARASVVLDLPALLGRSLAEAGVGEWAGDLVTRTSDTGPLRAVEPTDRPALARAAGYQATPLAPETTIVLVDDVILTGTTLSEVAGCLRGAGAGSVIGVVAARSRRVDTSS